MADYNIYIHAIGTGTPSAFNPIIPWSQREEGAGLNPTVSQSGGSVAGAIGRAYLIARNPDAIVGAGVGFLSKAIPIIAVASAVITIGTAVADKYTEYTSFMSGDYSARHNFERGRAMLNATLRPVNTWIEYRRNYYEIKKANERSQWERSLLGDSVINSYTNRGV